jgi:hypothetical protein
MVCDKCNLDLPANLIFKCDGHCDLVLCKVHILEHSKQVTMTHRTVPKLLGKIK